MLIEHLIELETGQLVKDDRFTLFESVGAIEVYRQCSGMSCIG